MSLLPSRRSRRLSGLPSRHLSRHLSGHPSFGWRALPRCGLSGVVRAYRYLLKPWLGSVCRFEPSCSAYALQALQRHGARRGAALAGWRLLRCHPWCDGGCDPVPEQVPDPVAGILSRLGLNRSLPAEGPPRPTEKSP